MLQMLIRHIEQRDYHDLHKLYSLPKAIEGTLQLPFPSEVMWKSRIENKPENLHVLVAEIEDTVLGSIGLEIQSLVRRRHVATLGMAVHDDWHGKGIGSALLSAALDLADNWYNIKRTELTVFTQNISAIKLYEKHGFEIEGTLKDYAYNNGKYVDVFSMARFRENL